MGPGQRGQVVIRVGEHFSLVPYSLEESKQREHL